MISGRISEILIDADTIGRRISEMGAQITSDYRGKPLICVCLLKGSMMFLSDLIRQIDMPLEVEVMQAASYEGTESSGSVKIIRDLDSDISGRDVLIVEDIVDTGRTLQKTLELLNVRHPASLKVCTLLNKPSRRVVNGLELEYVGFEIEDHFVVGYGLDYNQYYRNIPYVGILEL